MSFDRRGSESRVAGVDPDLGKILEQSSFTFSTLYDPREYIDPLSGKSISEIESSIRSDTPELGINALVNRTGVVAIFGGTFDLLTRGHIIPAYAARPQLAKIYGVAPEDVTILFMPAHQNPAKENAPSGNDEQRYRMLCETLKFHPGLYVCDYELKQAVAPIWEKQRRASMTADTLDVLTRIAPEAKFVWLIGSEYVQELSSWNRHADILKMADIAFMVRAGYEEGLRYVGDMHEKLALSDPDHSLKNRSCQGGIG